MLSTKKWASACNCRGVRLCLFNYKESYILLFAVSGIFVRLSKCRANVDDEVYSTGLKQTQKAENKS